MTFLKMKYKTLQKLYMSCNYTYLCAIKKGLSVLRKILTSFKTSFSNYSYKKKDIQNTLLL